MEVVAAPSPLKTPQSLGFYTIDAIIRQRAVDEKQAPLIGYPATKQGNTDYELFNGNRLNQLVDGAAKKFMIDGVETVNIETVIGILSASDLDYIVNIFALGRLGYTPFLISPRLSPHAISKLLGDVKATKLIYASHLESLASDAAAKYGTTLQLIPVITRLAYDFKDPTSPIFERQGVDPMLETKKMLIMLHSSGSTGLPKPIHYTNARLLATLLTAQPLRAFQSIPIFHAHGFVTLIQAIWTTKTTFLFNGHIAQTHLTLTEAIRKCEPEIVYTVPYALQLVAEKDEGIDLLRRCQVVSISGSRCPDELGDLLIREGVHFGTSFGATEVALILTSLNRPKEDTAWNYLRPPPHIAPFIFMKPLHGSSDPVIHECVVLDGHRGKMKSNSDDPPLSYYTSDLFILHPTIQNAWKFVGRLDDRVTLTNGEKVLPLAIEGRIVQESCVKEAVVFGVEREVPGLLVFRADGESCTEDEFLDRIWPAIEDANSRAEGFSQISRDMVVILPEGTECPTTDKSSIKRAQVYRDFAEVIDEVYVGLRRSTIGELYLDSAEMEIWIVKTFHSLGVFLRDETTDFFNAGVDSLKAIQMRGLIVKNLIMKGSADKISSMIVYDCGNAERLARRLVQIRDGLFEAEKESDSIAQIEDMIERFSMFTARNSSDDGKDSEHAIVLLTGATGSLGLHILSKLMDETDVSKIYCAIRKNESDDTAEKRLANAIFSHGFPQSMLSEKIVPLATEISEQGFGLSEELFQQLHKEVTHTIHCAWNVNFALPVMAFESQIKGVQNLVNFSLSSPFKQPTKLFFCSSIGVAMAAPRGTEDIYIQEAPIFSPRYASPTGYAQSKLVAETILEKATKDFGANATILRIGQIIPAPETGSHLWNPSEMIPLIVRSAMEIGVLPSAPGPDGDDRCAWIDVGTLAGTIVDIAGLRGCKRREADEKIQLVFNLVNPYHFSWENDFLPALKKAGLDFDILSWGDWLATLQRSDERNASRRLLSFWKALGAPSPLNAKRGGIVFETKGAERESRSFGEVKVVINDRYTEQLLSAWRNTWRIS